MNLERSKAWIKQERIIEPFIEYDNRDVPGKLTMTKLSTALSTVLEQYVEFVSKEEKPKDPPKPDYYLVKTIKNMWGIAYWDGVKFLDDPFQDKKLIMGIKREFIKEWYNLPK